LGLYKKLLNRQYTDSRQFYRECSVFLLVPLLLICFKSRVRKSVCYFCLHDIFNVILAYGMETAFFRFITKSLIKKQWLKLLWFQFLDYHFVLVIFYYLELLWPMVWIDSQYITYDLDSGVGCLGHHSVFKIKSHSETDGSMRQ
jgi:hypothetical protein